MIAEKLRGVKVKDLTNVKTFLRLSALVDIGEETIKVFGVITLSL